MKKTLVVFGGILVATIAACGLARILGLTKKSARPFNHKVHVQDQQMECVACHAKAGEEDKVAMPASLKKCMTCHEGGDEKKPAEKKLAALYPGEKPVWSSVTAVSEDVIFSHKAHVDKKVACAECHKGVETSTGVDDSLRVTMDACMDCHATRGKSNDCAVCHKTIRREVPPPNHDLSWKQAHGQAVRACASGQANQCNLCHTESSCVSCHQDEAPRSHTNFWRLQGHAVAAGVDRSACVTCHRDDFCDRCHQNTEPRSHVGTWGAPKDTHCLNCHAPLAAPASCATCHRGTPSHLSATPMPSWHNSGMNCRQCHGPGLSAPQPPHVDNGDACTGCHR